MWPTLIIYSLVCFIFINGTHDFGSVANKQIGIDDISYEQVIADRYLFSPYANESTGWSTLTNIRSIWQVQSLPDYHQQSSDGLWLLAEVEEAARNGCLYRMCWMSASTNGSLQVVANLSLSDNRSYLAAANNCQWMKNYTAAMISPRDIQLILCNQSDAAQCSVVYRIDFPSSIQKMTTRIAAGLFVFDKGLAGWLYVASDSGLHALDLNTLTVVPYVNEIRVSVSSLAWSSKYQTVFIGTAPKLWIEHYRSTPSQWRFEHVVGLIDAPITSLVYYNAQDQLWIGQSTGITLLSPVILNGEHLHWYFTRLSGHKSSPGSTIGHLPLANITCLSASLSDSSIWLGSTFGVMRWNARSTKANAWRVFNSGRYLPNRDRQVDISSLTVLNRARDAPDELGSTAVAVTSRGVTILRFQMWTLKDKAEHFQSFVDRSDRHVKYGFVSDCQMSEWGNPATCVKGPNDNDGLWTSMYLASQVFRYALTGDKQVKSSAWQHFQALYLLNQVSGIPGYPARSLAKRTDFPPTIDWYPSPIDASLQFKGDTSSDEIVGHQFVYPLVHDLLADSDEERFEALQVLYNITNHILVHDWYLIGEKGNHTTWGIWNPAQMNDNGFYQETRGLNSLQILAFLLQTYSFTGDERFFSGIKELTELYQYDVNLINEKMIALCDDSFSDDELAYLAYFNLAYACQTINASSHLSDEQKAQANLLIDHLSDYVQLGLELSHRYKQMEKSPFYNFIYCFVSGQANLRTSLPPLDCQALTNDSVWYLQRWPLELIDWPQFNRDRLDVDVNDLTEQCGPTFSRYSRELLPPDERSTHKWNGGPFDLDDGNGFNEEDPTSFLLSYWGMRYLHLLRN